MDLSIYIIVVATAAVIYGLIARGIQHKLGNRKQMEEIQRESKRLNQEYKDAMNAGKKDKAEEIMKEQMQLIGGMNKIMFAQFKPMLVIIGLFILFTSILGSFDPTLGDDVTVELNDAGTGCDSVSGDGVYSGCHLLESENTGKWTVTVKALNDGNEKASNATLFYLGERTDDDFVEQAKGEIEIGLDKDVYQPGEEILITAVHKSDSQGFFDFFLGSGEYKAPHSMIAVLDSGTHFEVELPFTIPLLNVKTIYQPYWWFIFISLIFSLTFSLIIGRFLKK